MQPADAVARMCAEVRTMTRLFKIGLSLALPLLLLLTVQAATAKTPSGSTKQTRSPVTTLAMDGSRVVYASGGKVYVWNDHSGTTTLIKGRYSKHTSEVAIAGKRVAWITRYAVGNSYNTQEDLFTASLEARGRLLAEGRRYLGGSETNRAWYGRWIAGAVGSGNTLAVSTWWSAGDGSCTGQKLSLVSASGLRKIATGPGAIIAASANSGHIAVLRSEEAWPAYAPTPAVSVGIYSTSGSLLREITPSSADEVALSGNELVVLTETKTLEVYDWTTGSLLHTWPVAVSTPRLHPGHLAVSGQIAVYSVDPRFSSPRKLHVLRLTRGKDVVLASGKGGGYYWSRDAAMGPLGLVYVVNYRDHGKLVFVPTAKLLAAVS
jgi:hypothetical protein